MKVGFIGLGAMGLPMARNVINSGYDLLITFHRRREPVTELAALGATVCNSPAEIASMADVIITVLPADAELKEVILGEDGLATRLSPGRVIIDMTTATPFVLQDIERRLRSAGVGVLDAPVSGGTAAATDGTLTIMVGGDERLLEEYRPLLQTMAAKIFHVGDVGQGKVVKMVNQLMAAVHLLVLGEAFSLGVRSGASPEILEEVIRSSSGYSKMMDLRLRDFILKGAFDPGFKLDLMRKDLDLALASAKQLNIPLLLGSVASQLMAAASGSGAGEKDFSAAAQFLADLARADLTGWS